MTAQGFVFVHRAPRRAPRQHAVLDKKWGWMMGPGVNPAQSVNIQGRSGPDATRNPGLDPQFLLFRKTKTNSSAEMVNFTSLTKYAFNCDFKYTKYICIFETN
jgi:hypothetical protein